MITTQYHDNPPQLIQHAELKCLGENAVPVSVAIEPIDTGDRWRLSITDESGRCLRLRAFRGGERTWAQVGSAISYLWDVLPHVREVRVCRT